MADSIDTTTGEVFDAPDPGSMNLIGLLMAQQDGAFVADCDHELRYIVSRLKEVMMNENRDAKAELTIKLKIKSESHALKITAECAAKAPGPRPTIGLAFADEEGHLYKQDPNQPVFNFDRARAFRRGK